MAAGVSSWPARTEGGGGISPSPAARSRPVRSDRSLPPPLQRHIPPVKTRRCTFQPDRPAGDGHTLGAGRRPARAVGSGAVAAVASAGVLSGRPQARRPR